AGKMRSEYTEAGGLSPDEVQKLARVRKRARRDGRNRSLGRSEVVDQPIEPVIGSLRRLGPTEAAKQSDLPLLEPSRGKRDPGSEASEESPEALQQELTEFIEGTVCSFGQHVLKVLATAHGFGLMYTAMEFLYRGLQWMKVVQDEGGLGMQTP